MLRVNEIENLVQLQVSDLQKEITLNTEHVGFREKESYTSNVKLIFQSGILREIVLRFL